jgi:hypothetical protein
LLTIKLVNINNLIFILCGSILLLSCDNSIQKSTKNTESKADQNVNLVDVSKKKPAIVLENVDSKFITTHFKFKGKPIEFIKWKDAIGSHITFTTLTNIVEQNDPEGEFYGKTRYLNCYHYSENEGYYKLSWIVSDFVENCPVDLTLSFIKKSLHITDLNKDGIGEIWTMYRSACRGGVDPSEHTLIMYEGSKKHQIKGESKIEISEADTYGGEITEIKGFKDGDPFVEYAKNFWKKNSKETWE